MGREIKRVPFDWDFPLNETWTGYLMPEKFEEVPCPDCERGHSWQYEVLHDLWYGYRPFDSVMTGSTPWQPDHPVIRGMAERHIEQAAWHYGSGEAAILREAQRLANHFNNGWSHHLSQVDVDVLVKAGRLYDFTHQWVKGEGWKPKDVPVHPTAAQVNEWSLHGMGHDSSNAWLVINARCERYGMPTVCATCDGHGGLEAYPGQREEAEAWEREEPPTGEGWQLWQTVSEGGPISPVFETPEELARWMASPAYCWGASRDSGLAYEDALAFVKEGWAPSFVATPQNGVETGEQYIGRTALDIAEVVSDGTPALERGSE